MHLHEICTFPDWRRPEDREDIVWIGDESQQDKFDITDTDFEESSESWLTDNMNVPPDTGESEGNDSEESISEKPKTSADLLPEDPEDVV